MNYVIVAENFPEKSAKKLEKYGTIIRTKKNKKVMEGLNTHPDILVHPLPSGEIVVDKDNFDYYKEIFKDRKIISSHSQLSGKYPRDVALNAFTFKNYFIHNLKHTDKKLLEYYKERGYELTHIKQGYSKCTTLVTENFLITSDGGTYEKLRDILPIYRINHKEIKLQNFNYGFIGGASGSLDKKIFFTGSIKEHSSYKEIMKIIEKYNYEIEILSKEPIEDYGSIYFI
ncbi:DUF6873 family GME fold protein [Peptoniphilus porci]|uniref:DUF6873 domain-containing protein n=1 Tax=Peptoniphilus porci TaxID=2652280 RepID=A0A1U7LZ38_9FIRM|nr:hypothetical protein [Peptoniphilus porci]OLR64618.1 hypothetical protein BIV18_03240 [Peptoniphilus porci]